MAFGCNNQRITQLLPVHEVIHSLTILTDKYSNLTDKDPLFYTPALAELMRPQGNTKLENMRY